MSCTDATLEGQRAEMIEDGDKSEIKTADKITQVMSRRGKRRVADQLRGAAVLGCGDGIFINLEPEEPAYCITRTSWVRNDILRRRKAYDQSQPDGKRPRNPETQHHHIGPNNVGAAAGLMEPFTGELA